MHASLIFHCQLKLRVYTNIMQMVTLDQSGQNDQKSQNNVNLFDGSDSSEICKYFYADFLESVKKFRMNLINIPLGFWPKLLQMVIFGQKVAKMTTSMSVEVNKTTFSCISVHFYITQAYQIIFPDNYDWDKPLLTQSDPNGHFWSKNGRNGQNVR